MLFDVIAQLFHHLYLLWLPAIGF